MQFWPRKRAKKVVPRVKAWAGIKEAKLLGFAGYKAGMTHIMYTDNYKHSMNKGQDLMAPVTVIECPPIKIAGVRFYKNDAYGKKVVTDVIAQNLDKELIRKAKLKGNKKIEEIKPEAFDDLMVVVYTQPKFTTIGKKKPDVMEIALGGKKEDKLNYAKQNLGKEIAVGEVLKEGQQIDVHATTKGKGFQGTVKRFGVKIRSHKSEKTKRGNILGPEGYAKVKFTAPQPGKMGFHTRTHYNLWLMKVSSTPEEVNPKGGFVRYGNIKSSFVLIKGSVQGSQKKIVRMNTSIRPNRRIPSEAPAIQKIILESKQGR